MTNLLITLASLPIIANFAISEGDITPANNIEMLAFEHASHCPSDEKEVHFYYVKSAFEIEDAVFAVRLKEDDGGYPIFRIRGDLHRHVKTNFCGIK